MSYIVDLHKNLTSLQESFSSKKFVYLESQNAFNSLTEVATQISSIEEWWVLSYINYNNNNLHIYYSALFTLCSNALLKKQLYPY